MKTINFINTLSADHHKELTRWAQVSIVLCIAVLVAIGTITTYKFMALNALKKEQNAMSQTETAHTNIIQMNEALKKQELELTQKFTVISSWNDATKQTAQLLQAIYKTVTLSGALESVTLNNKKITIVALSKQTGAAMQMIKSLKVIPEIENIALVSLQPKQQKDQSMVHITLKGTLKN
ncbi:MAG: hypothetical protein P4L31_05440 [Candidatus Babeliales bacterium]|nr:hypothetical protein [Candidatus Babeliales bacterium]